MGTHFFQIGGQALGTSYSVVYEASGDLALQNKIDDLLEVFDNSLSVYNPESILSKVNRNETIEVDDFFVSVFIRAKEISEKTDGLFDISAELLFREWGFSFDNSKTPNQEKITFLLKRVGMSQIKLEGKVIVKSHPDIQLNMNAIAKGYFTDIIAELLESYSVKNYLVEVGGEIRTRGISPRGSGWRVGIDRPTDNNIIPGQDVQVVLELTDKALATSGNYRQYYYKDGKKISHTINPKTGQAVSHSLLSVTVVADDAMSADAYATAFLVAGIDGALELLDNISDKLDILFICDEDGKFKVHYTEGLEKYLVC